MPNKQPSSDIHSHKADTKLPHKPPLCTSCDKDFFKPTSIGYTQPW